MSTLLIAFLCLVVLSSFLINALPYPNNTSQAYDSKSNFKKDAILLQSNFNNVTSNISSIPVLPDIQLPENFNVTEILKNIERFGIRSLKDDEHIKGLPLDRHGKINPDFHKEIFLGNHEVPASTDEDNRRILFKKLEEIFLETDSNRDKFLSSDELISYVLRNIEEHIEKAKNKNLQLFLLIDTNNDGKVTWHEYAVLYIKFHDINTSNIEDFYNIKITFNISNPSLREELNRIRHRWRKADNDNDNDLNIDEFLQFRHPEIFSRSHKDIVQYAMEELDRNGDERISENEFLLTNPSILSDENNDQSEKLNKKGIEEQKQAFHDMDQNQDGFLTANEISDAFNPTNRAFIKIQIKRLFSKVDDSPKDNLISLEEMKKHSDVFTNVHYLEAENILHGEI